MKIPLHKPFWGKKAELAMIRAMRTGAGVADGPESMVMREKLKELTGAKFALPVTSCTHAMEAAVACLGAKTGDEVIVPSFTLASTATAVMIRSAKPVFADIDPVTYCLDPNDVERRITKRTVGIITVHYAGMAGPNFDALLRLAKAHKLWVVEDAAHCIGSFYLPSSLRSADHGSRIVKVQTAISPSSFQSQGRDDASKWSASPRRTSLGSHLGTFGDAGALSFHGTKNVAAGEGGAILTNSTKLADKMEIFRAIGTDRQAFLQGKVSLYQWVGEGSSFMLSDLLASLVNIQLDQIERINKDRRYIASQYLKALHDVQLPVVPKGMTQPNWHIFAIRCKNKDRRMKFMKKMREKYIEVSTHYVPLHISPMGRKIAGKIRLPVTEAVADTLIRMPIYAGMAEKELDYVITTAKKALR